MNMTGPHDARLTLKQQKFVEEYLVDGNGSAAYQRSGFRSTGNVAEVCAYQLLRIPQVKAAITAARQRLSRKTELDAFWVEERLMRTVERCLEPRPIVDRQGISTSSYTFDSQGALKGLELLAKRLQLFTEKQPEQEPETPSASTLALRQRLLLLASRIRSQGEDGESPPDVPLGDPPIDPPPLEPPPDDAPPDDAPTPAPPLDPPSDPPPFKTARDQLLARFTSSQSLRPCSQCGESFHPRSSEKQCCYACACRARGTPHRKEHTEDCQRGQPVN